MTFTRSRFLLLWVYNTPSSNILCVIDDVVDLDFKLTSNPSPYVVMIFNRAFTVLKFIMYLFKTSENTKIVIFALFYCPILEYESIY